MFGKNFDDGAVILLNGEAQKTKKDVPDPATGLRGKKTAKLIAVGQAVSLQVRNGSGALSPAFLFTRGAQ